MFFSRNEHQENAKSTPGPTNQSAGRQAMEILSSTTTNAGFKPRLCCVVHRVQKQAADRTLVLMDHQLAIIRLLSMPVTLYEACGTPYVRKNNYKTKTGQ